MAYISYKKMSKKKRRQIDKEKRGTWGNILPVTKKIPSAKLYNRKKTRRRQDEQPTSGFAI